VDISDQLVTALNAKLRQEVDMKAFQARLAQRRLASALGQDRRAMNGLGRVRMEVSSEVHHYWGQRLGYKCWRDEQFLREMERDNPEVRVKCGGTKLQVGFSPTGSGAAVKYAKTYSTEISNLKSQISNPP